jgi:tetratricopeptide (TPR) repeat protein
MAFDEYLDFNIRISACDDRGYAVSVRSPGGDAQSRFSPPTLDPAYQQLIDRLASGDTDQDMLDRLGSVLFQALFYGPMKDVYARSQGVLQPGQGLRLTFDIDASALEVAGLPWEFLYDPDQGPLAMLDAPVMRYLPQSQVQASLALPIPLKVLLTGASVDSSADVAGEIATVQAALEGLGDQVRVHVEPHLTYATLQRRLREKFHVWHFVGSGGFSEDTASGWLAFEGINGSARIDAPALNILLKRSGVQLAVLSADESARLGREPLRGIASALIRAQTPAVVAMQFPIQADATNAFATEFYGALAEGLPIDACVTEGRKAVMRVSGLGCRDWGGPVVYTRTPDGQLFLRRSNMPPVSEQPPDLAGFIGREQELEIYAQQLASEQLTVITGMPGVGKTLLAAALATRSASAQRIFWHSFHKDEGGDELIWALAGFLAWHDQVELWQMLFSSRKNGSSLPPNNVLINYLLQMLHGKDYLLCLDDYQFVDQDPLVRQIVERLSLERKQGAVGLIVTSRHTLDFAQFDEAPALDGLSSLDARRFSQGRGLTLADDLFDKLYRATGGNPQFLTLAAEALKRAPDPASLIGQLVGQRVETKQIEKYLMDRVDEGLFPKERAAMGAVAVLLGYPGTQDAVEAVLNGLNVRRELRQLYSRNLLTVTVGKEYGQHAIVQAFYYDLLSKGERRDMHLRAGSYYETEEKDLLKAAQHFNQAGDHACAADLLTSDVLALVNQGQARQACQFLELFTEQQLDPDRWIAVLMARAKVYQRLRQRKQAEACCQEALTRLQGLPESASVRERRAQVCNEMGLILSHSDSKAAIEWLQHGLAELAQIDEPESTAQHTFQEGLIRLALGAVLGDMGDYKEAAQSLEHSLRLLPEGPHPQRGAALMTLGNVYLNQGNYQQATSYHQQALTIYEFLHNDWRIASLRSNLGQGRHLAGDWPQAETEYQTALNLATRIGNISDQIIAELNLGNLRMAQGNDAGATEHLEHSLALAREHDLRQWVVYCQSTLASIHVQLRAWAAAKQQLDEAEPLALELDAGGILPEIYRSRAELHLGLGERKDALTYAQQAIDRSRELGSPREQGISMRILGQVLLASGGRKPAIAAFQQSAALLEGQDPYEIARTQAVWGRTLLTELDPVRGCALLDTARHAFAQLGAQRDLAEIETLPEC